MPLNPLTENMNRISELVIPGLDSDLDVIQKLDDEPNDVGGLTAAELKAKFDEAGNLIKTYLNDTLLPALSNTVAEEEVRAAAEAQRVANEEGRVANEEGRVAAEQQREQAEAARTANEETRINNESTRNRYEVDRITSERSRKNAEIERKTAEQTRVTQETARDQAETRRESNEALRESAELGRTDAEDLRYANENTRQTNEMNRIQAEQTRVTQEQARDQAESDRQAAEQAREAAGSGIIAQATEQANASEAWAVGTRGGSAVPSTDPTYQNNAKYYAQQAGGAASVATSKASDAQTAAQNAAQSEANAQGAAEQAAQDAAAIAASATQIETNKDNIEALQSALAPEYDSTDTYAVGDFRIYNGLLYKCTTAITAAEEWTAEHWTAVTVTGEAADLKSAVNAIMDSDYFSFFDLAWENGSLDNNGAEIPDPGTNTRYRSAFIQPNSFETLVLFIPRFCRCYGYRYDSSKNFLGFVAGGWLGATDDNRDGIVKIQSDGETAFYRFVFGAWNHYSGGPRAITSIDLANTYCFHINRFPDDKSEISNLQFVIGAMEDYYNLTIPTNTARANTFFIPVSSRHMVLSIPDGYQIYTWQLDGDFQYIRERGWSTGSMYYFLEEDTEYIRFVAKTDIGSDTPSTEALKAVSVSFLPEIDKVPVNPVLRENTLIAHRGYSITAPENTIPAIELAAQYGFKQVEVDLQFTSDGVCVLLHDNTINRTSNGTGNIYDMTYAEALQYDFGSWKSAEYAGTKIPTLREALLVCKYYGMCAQLDIADTNKTNITAQNLQTMLDVVAETGMFANVNICAEDDRARKVVALRPGLIMCIGVGNTEATFNGYKDIAKGCALLIGSNSVSTATDTMMKRCHKNGMPYQIWTIDSADTAIAKFKAGYDWIITNSLKPTDVS